MNIEVSIFLSLISKMIQVHFWLPYVRLCERVCGDDVDWLDGREGFENSYPLNLASSLEAI